MTPVRKYAPTSRNLSADIKQILLDRGLRSGDPLPSESELIELLAVSRGTLREALKGLQALEIIETRHGTGSFVGKLSLRAMTDGLTFHSQLGQGQDDLSTAADLTDIREILETALIQRVAEEVSEAKLANLHGLAQQLGDAAAGGFGAEFHRADRQFHRALYDDIGNALVLQLLDGFWHTLDSVRDSLPAPFDMPEDAARKHHAILIALRKHDPESAQEAMRDHFALTRPWILVGRK